MKVQLFTLNEITDTLRRLSNEEDSIKALLGSGQFRTKFEDCVIATRAQREASSITDLPERLVPITQNGEDVYILDDIQGALSKKQFAVFMTFLQTQHLVVDADAPTYVPINLVELFIQAEGGKPELLGVDEDELTSADEGAILKIA